MRSLSNEVRSSAFDTSVQNTNPTGDPLRPLQPGMLIEARADELYEHKRDYPPGPFHYWVIDQLAVGEKLRLTFRMHADEFRHVSSKLSVAIGVERKRTRESVVLVRRHRQRLVACLFLMCFNTTRVERGRRLFVVSKILVNSEHTNENDVLNIRTTLCDTQINASIRLKNESFLAIGKRKRFAL